MTAVTDVPISAKKKGMAQADELHIQGFMRDQSQSIEDAWEDHFALEITKNARVHAEMMRLRRYGDPVYRQPS